MIIKHLGGTFTHTHTHKYRIEKTEVRGTHREHRRYKSCAVVRAEMSDEVVTVNLPDFSLNSALTVLCLYISF